MRYVDLSMPLDSDTPVYPGDPTVEITKTSDLAEDGYLDHAVKMGAHNGTHIDAAAHMITDGPLLEDYEISKFVGPGRVLDVRRGISAGDPQLSTIEAGDIVILWSAFSDNYLADDYYERVPELAYDAVREMVDRRPSMIAIDAGSIDAEPFALHKLILGAGILLAENLVNVAELANAESEIFALPLRLQAEAAPARILARVR